MAAELRTGWVAHVATEKNRGGGEAGGVFYQHLATGRVQWDHPGDPRAGVVRLPAGQCGCRREGYGPRTFDYQGCPYRTWLAHEAEAVRTGARSTCC